MTNKRFTNGICEKSNEKIRYSWILLQENRKCKNWNDKIEDSRILSQKFQKCENQMRK